MELSPKNYYRLYHISECLKHTANLRLMLKLYRQAYSELSLIGERYRIDYQTIDFIHEANVQRTIQTANKIGRDMGLSNRRIWLISALAFRGGKNA